MDGIGHQARVVMDLDFLRDFLDLGHRFAGQEQHQSLYRLLASALQEVDRIRRAERLDSQCTPQSEVSRACSSASSIDDTGNDAGTLIVLSAYRATPKQD